MKRSDKVLRWLFPALIVISFVINYAGSFDRRMDVNGDNYYYYMLAQSLAEGKGYVSDIGPEPVPHTHFPPGYPAFMSLLMHIFPDNAVAMKVLNGVLLLFALLMLYQIIVRTVPRHGRFVGLVACLLCTLHTFLLRWSTIIMSEMLYVAVSLGIIAVFLWLDWDKLAKKRPGQILLVALLCALVFFTYYIRTIGISVVLAVMAALAFIAARRKKIAPLIVCALVAVSLLAAHESWSIRNRRVAPGFKSDYLTSFKMKSPKGGQMSTAGDWTYRIGVNLKRFVSYYIPISMVHPVNATRSPESLPDLRWTDWVLGIVVIGLILAGLATMKGIGWLLILYVLITFAVLMVYPESYGGIRYFIPLLPVMIAGLAAGVYALAGWILKAFKRLKAPWLQPALLTVVLVLLGFVYIKDQWFYRKLASDEYYRYSPVLVAVDELIEASEFFSRTPDHVLTAVIKPEIFYFHSGGHHAVGIPRQGTPEEVVQYLTDQDVDFVIIDHYFEAGYRVVGPATTKYPEKFKLVTTYGDDKTRPTLIFQFLRR